MKLTPPDKGSNHVYCKLKDVNFLQRGFSIVNGTQRMPSSLECINKMLQFDRRDYDLAELTKEKLRAFECEMSHYPERVYVSYVNLIKPVLRHAGIDFTFRKHRDILSQMASLDQ